MEILKMASWSGDWAWSFPLIVLSVVIHVLGLVSLMKELFEFLRAPLSLDASYSCSQW